MKLPTILWIGIHTFYYHHPHLTCIYKHILFCFALFLVLCYLNFFQISIYVCAFFFSFLFCCLHLFIICIALVCFICSVFSLHRISSYFFFFCCSHDKQMALIEIDCIQIKSEKPVLNSLILVFLLLLLWYICA